MSVHGDVLGRRRAAAVVLGGGLVATGALLPWITLFAGLQHYSGLIGLYGWLVLAGGVASVGIGLAMFVRRGRWLQLAGLTLGLGLTIFVVWLVGRLFETMHGVGADAMLVARPGPGLFVAIVGSIVVTVAACRGLAVPQRSQRSHALSYPPERRSASSCRQSSASTPAVTAGGAAPATGVTSVSSG